MRHFLSILILIFFGFIQSCSYIHTEKSKNIKTDSLSLDNTKADSIDSLFKLDIINANKKFKINDKHAIRLIRQINELKEIIDWKDKNDSTIINEVIVDGVPNDTNPIWTINIRQYQPRIQQSTSLMDLYINANDGNIRIWDIYRKDTILTLKEWRKLKANK